MKDKYRIVFLLFLALALLIVLTSCEYFSFQTNTGGEATTLIFGGGDDDGGAIDGNPSLSGAGASGNIYYVSTTGSDLGDGSTNFPWKTIQHAADNVAAGDTVIVESGTYVETVELTNSGTQNNPITFIANGNVVIDPAKSFDNSWVLAPEIGTGIYKINNRGVPVDYMAVDGKRLPGFYAPLSSEILNSYYVNDGFDVEHQSGDFTNHTGFEMMNFAPDKMTWYNYRYVQANYWDGFEGVFGNNGSYTYIRFKDYDDPNAKSISYSSDGDYSLHFNGVDYVIFDGFTIQNGEQVVRMDNGASHNVINNSNIRNGVFRVHMTGFETSYNKIANSNISVEFYSNYLPGAWSVQDYNSPERIIQLGFYYRYKKWYGPSLTNDAGVNIDGAGDYNEIYNNNLSYNLRGISIFGEEENPTVGTRIYNNTVTGGSSIGIAPASFTIDTYIYNNLIYDNNINLRVHEYDEPGENTRTMYIYGNKFYQPENVSEHIFNHRYDSNSWPNGQTHPMIYIYHNTFFGGKYLYTGSSNITGEGMPNTLFVNNIISTHRNIGTGVLVTIMPTLFRSFDYNIDYNIYDHVADYYYDPLDTDLETPIPDWYGEHNIFSENIRWTDFSSLPSFELEENSLAIDAGIDISQPFTINGVNYPALPGFEEGYFNGAAPDMGAIETNYNTGGNTYYVSTTGDDNNDGLTLGSAFQTINYGLSQMSTDGGDTLLVSGGLYNERLSSFRSGTSSSPNIIRCLLPNECIIQNTISISDWIKNGDIYSNSEDIENVNFLGAFKNDNELSLAREPELGEFFEIESFPSINKIESSDFAALPNDIIGSTAKIYTQIAGAFYSRAAKVYKASYEVISSNGNQVSLSGLNSEEFDLERNKYFIFFENDIDILDTSNEYFVDETTDTMYMYSNPGTIETTQELSGSEHYPFTMYDKHNIVFDGFKINFGKSNMNIYGGSTNISIINTVLNSGINSNLFVYDSSHDLMFDNLTVQNSKGSNIVIQPTSNISIINSNIKNPVFGSNIYIYNSTNILLENNSINGSSLAYSVYLDGFKNSIVNNNLITYPSTGAMKFGDYNYEYSEYVTISNNEIAYGTAAYEVLEIHGSRHMNIFNNYIHDNLGESILLEGNNNVSGSGVSLRVYNISIYNNTLVRNAIPKEDVGNYITWLGGVWFSDTDNSSFYNNYMYGETNRLFIIDSSMNNHIYNNVFVGGLLNSNYPSSCISFTSGGTTSLPNYNTNIYRKLINNTFERNTIYRCNSGIGFGLSDPDLDGQKVYDNIVRDNIIYNVNNSMVRLNGFLTGQYSDQVDDFSAAGNILDNNIYYIDDPVFSDRTDKDLFLLYNVASYDDFDLYKENNIYNMDENSQYNDPLISITDNHEVLESLTTDDFNLFMPDSNSVACSMSHNDSYVGAVSCSNICLNNYINPQPKNMVSNCDSLILVDNTWEIFVDNESEYNFSAEYLSSYLSDLSGDLISIDIKNIDELNINNIQKSIIIGNPNDNDKLNLLQSNIGININDELSQGFNQGYFILGDEDKIIILGNSTIATLYGVVTLKQLLIFNNNLFKMNDAIITDWPDLEYRAFYGSTVMGSDTAYYESFEGWVDELLMNKYNLWLGAVSYVSNTSSFTSKLAQLNYMKERGFFTITTLSPLTIRSHDPNYYEGVYAKDVSFTFVDDVAVPTQATENPIINGGFEEGLDEDGNPIGWYYYKQNISYDYWSIDCTQSHSGSCSAKLTQTYDRTGMTSGAHMYSVNSSTGSYTIEPGIPYQITFWAKKIQEEDDIKPQFTVYFKDENGVNVGSSRSTVVEEGDDEWRKYKVSFVSYPDTKYFSMYSRAQETTPFEAWIDDVELHKMSEELTNVLRTPYTELEIWNEDNTIKYVEDVDYYLDEVGDWDLMNLQNGKKTIIYRIPQGAIQDNDVVKISYDFGVSFQTTRTPYNTLSDPSFFEVYDNYMLKPTMENLNPDFVFLGMDEIRGFNRDSRSEIDDLENYEVFAHFINNITRLIKNYNPDVKILIWDDMFNPFHNGGYEDYQTWYGGKPGKVWYALDLMDRSLIPISWRYGITDTTFKMPNSPNLYRTLGFDFFSGPGVYASSTQNIYWWSQLTNEYNGIGMVGHEFDDDYINYRNVGNHSWNLVSFDSTVDSYNLEICDGMDNDGNDIYYKTTSSYVSWGSYIDEGFNLSSDIFNCGECGNICYYPKGFSSCSEGVCEFDGCYNGYFDADGIASNGCECEFTNGAIEVCDEFDNDCDGYVNEGLNCVVEEDDSGGNNGGGGGAGGSPPPLPPDEPTPDDVNESDNSSNNNQNNNAGGNNNGGNNNANNGNEITPTVESPTVVNNSGNTSVTTTGNDDNSGNFFTTITKSISTTISGLFTSGSSGFIVVIILGVLLVFGVGGVVLYKHFSHPTYGIDFSQPNVEDTSSSQSVVTQTQEITFSNFITSYVSSDKVGIMNYLDNVISSGLSNEQISSLLQKSGWNSTAIETAFYDYKLLKYEFGIFKFLNSSRARGLSKHDVTLMLIKNGWNEGQVLEKINKFWSDE